MNSNFEILVPRGEPTPMVVNTALARGTGMNAHATIETEAIVAVPAGGFIGFLNRETSASAPGLREAILEVGNGDDGLLNAVKTGGHVSILDAEEFECEGTDYLAMSGTGDIDSGTAIGTELSFEGGKLREAQVGDRVWFLVTANSEVASSTLAAKNGGTRIRAKRAGGYVKA